MDEVTLKVLTDGTANGTIVSTSDGKKIKNITGIALRIDSSDNICHVRISVDIYPENTSSVSANSENSGDFIESSVITDTKNEAITDTKDDPIQDTK